MRSCSTSWCRFKLSNRWKISFFWNKFQRTKINYTIIPYYDHIDGGADILLPNGTWTGLFGKIQVLAQCQVFTWLLQSGDIDILLGEWQPTLERRQHFQFTDPFAITVDAAVVPSTFFFGKMPNLKIQLNPLPSPSTCSSCSFLPCSRRTSGWSHVCWSSSSSVWPSPAVGCGRRAWGWRILSRRRRRNAQSIPDGRLIP